MTVEEKISQLLETEYIGRNLLYFDRLSSTNEFLKNMASQMPDGTVTVAGQQYAGRGRRGNRWISSKGQTAEMSVMLKNCRISSPPVTLICGLSVAQTLNELCGGGFLIKWPNDIVCNQKKVCGILCESKISKSSNVTVCGIGINVSQPAEFFNEAGLPYGASIKMLKNAASENERIIASVLNRFEKIYTILKDGGEREAAAFIAEYSELCVTLNHEILAKKADGEIQGFADKINPDGTLSVRFGDETVSLTASEVSVRGIMGYL